MGVFLSHDFSLSVSNCEKDAPECLRKYRARETIEFFFEYAMAKGLSGALGVIS